MLIGVVGVILNGAGAGNPVGVSHATALASCPLLIIFADKANGPN